MVRLPRLGVSMLSVCAAVLAAGAPMSLALAQGQPEPGQQEGGRGRRGPGGGGFGGGPGGGFGGGMFGGGGPGGMLQPGVNTREMEKYAEFLALSSDQKAAVTALHEAFQQDFADAAQAARDRMEQLRNEAADDEDPGARWERFGKEMQGFRTKRNEMEVKFFEDVKGLLTPEQAEKWPTLERDRRRERTMNRGLLSGERVDVVRLVEGLELPADVSAPLGATLDQYKVELDRELIVRNAFQEEAMTKMGELFRSGDMDAVEKMFADGRKIADRVREVNRRYARQIEDALPEDARAKFAEAVRRESFPMIYRPSFASRTVDAALAIEDLDEAQKTAVATLRESFTRDLAAMNKKMETAWEDREKNIKPADMMPGMGGGGRGGMGGFETDEMRDMRRERRELEDAAIEKVRALLNEEQAKKLPEREGREGRGGPDGGDQRGPRQRRGRDGEGENVAPAPGAPDRRV